jgi:signal transduction histidine kinase
MIVILNYILFEIIPGTSIIHYFTAIAAIATIAIIFKYRMVPEVKYLICIVFSAAIWAFTYGMEFISSEFADKVLWSKLSYFGIAFIPVSYFLFTKTFSQRTDIVKLREKALLSIIPLITLILIITNDYHKLMWAEVNHDQEKNMILYEYGVWFWLFWLYSVVLIILGLVILIRSINFFTGYYKAQVLILILATLIPLTGNIMYVTGLTPFPGFDLTPVLFVFSAIVITTGIINFGMFELVPLARNKLIDTMEDGVVVINSKGTIEDHNLSLIRIFNLNGQIKGKLFTEIFAGYNDMINAIENNQNEQLNIETKSDDRKSYYQVRISPLMNHKNIFSGNLIQIHDITCLKLGEEKMTETNRHLLQEIEQRGKLIDDLDAFAHTIAHDLRNSLGSIYSSSEVIQETLSEMADADFLIELSDLIRNSAQKAMHITEELLILATVRNEKIERKPLAMKSIFHEAESQLKGMIKENKARIISPDTWPQATGHAPWVEEVWVNYITNAIKYGGTPPLIEVGADQPSENFVRYWIKDNGNGITKEKQTKLFKKYARLAPEKAHGYGLGLSIVKRIIDKLGGRVGVISSGYPGEGAKFWFELPVN